MQRVKFLALAAILVLVAGAFFSSQAQKKMTNHRMPPVAPVDGILSGTYASSVNATEISAGSPGGFSEVFGWTCYGPTKGDLSGFIFLSMNYGAANPLGGSGADPNILPPSSSEVSGGSWSKLIFVNGVYMGSISGRILGGVISWEKGGQTAAIELKLTSDKGTNAYIGSVGMGSFEGTMDRTGASPLLSGILTLNY